MKKITHFVTTEQVLRYESEDGKWFDTEEKCLAYEKKLSDTTESAMKYLVGRRFNDKLFNSTFESLIVFDLPDKEAYRAVLAWAKAYNAYDVRQFTRSYIGKRVAFLATGHDYGKASKFEELSFHTAYATKKKMLTWFKKEIDYLFADKED